VSSHPAPPNAPLGADLPEGVRFVGEAGGTPSWAAGERPSLEDLNACVACGLCLPHCPTYRLTGEESASPRGRIAAMHAVHDGAIALEAPFMASIDGCLVCRACEDVCPSHVPFGRMMEAARTQVEPMRSRRARALRSLGLDVVLPRPVLLGLAAFLQPLVRPFLPPRLREQLPRAWPRRPRVPATTEPPPGVQVRGTVALLTGCVQNLWFREVNLASVRVLARNGWRVQAPRAQRCCGALAAHNGRLDNARALARRNARAFAGADRVIVNAAGCGAHMTGYEELAEGTGLPVEDLMVFLDREGTVPPTTPAGGPLRVAYHDACHALRAQGVHDEPRRVLGLVPGLEVVEIASGDRCCGAAGLYQVTEPELSGRLMGEKAEAIRATGATTIASANPGCSIQIAAGLRALGVTAEVLHPVQFLDQAYRTEGSP
jgi:glycolate oxidase iron-sulfur subunit